MLRIERVSGTLPEGLNSLLHAAEAEAVRNMRLLRDEWTAGTQRFDAPGAGLFAVLDGSRLVGVGGVTPETRLTETAMRMRRFYVLPEVRRLGAGRRLANMTMGLGWSHARLLTCNAGASPLAAPFWESMGFTPVDWDGVTHICRKS